MKAAWVALGVSALASAGVEHPQFLGPPASAIIRRVITLAPSLTETVLALEAGSRLVGVSRFDELPQVASLPRVGGFIDPSVEAVLGLKPDLVLVQPAPGNQKPVEKMAELGTPVLVLPMHTVAETLEAIRAVANALGERDRGEKLVHRIQATRDRIREQAKTLKHPRVLFVYGFEPLIVAGPGSFAHELLLDAGGENAASAAQTPYSVYSAESAVRARPDVVVNAADTDLGREQVASLPGLRESRWVKPPSQDLLHPGPKLAEGLEQLFVLLHPDQKAMKRSVP